MCVCVGGGGAGITKGLSTREAGRGHATPHMPVETVLFSKACPIPLKVLNYITHQELESSYSLKVNADCTAAFATHPRIWFYF